MSQTYLPLHDRCTNPVLTTEATGEEAVIPALTPLEHFFTLVHEDSVCNSSVGSIDEEKRQVYKKQFNDHAGTLRSQHEHIQAARMHVKAVSSVCDNILETGRLTVKKVSEPSAYTIPETDAEVRLDALKTVTMSKSRALATAGQHLGQGAQRVFEQVLGNSRYAHDLVRLSSFFLTSWNDAGTPVVQVGLSSGHSTRLNLAKAAKGGVYTALDSDLATDAMYARYLATNSRWDAGWWRVVARRLVHVHKQALAQEFIKVLVEEARLVSHSASLFHPFQYITDDLVVYISTTEIQVRVVSQGSLLCFPLAALSRALVGGSDAASSELSAPQTKLQLQTLQFAVLGQQRLPESLDVLLSSGGNSGSNTYSSLMQQRRAAWLAGRRATAATAAFESLLTVSSTHSVSHRALVGMVDHKHRLPRSMYRRAVPDRVHPVPATAILSSLTTARTSHDQASLSSLEGLEISPVTATKLKTMVKAATIGGTSTKRSPSDSVLTELNDISLSRHHASCARIPTDPISGAPVVFTSVFLTLVRSILSLRTHKLISSWLMTLQCTISAINNKITSLQQLLDALPPLQELYDSPYSKSCRIQLTCEHKPRTLFCSQIFIFFQCSHPALASSRIPLYDVDVDTHLGVIQDHIYDTDQYTSENIFLPYAKPSLLPILQVTTILENSLQEL